MMLFSKCFQLTTTKLNSSCLPITRLSEQISSLFQTKMSIFYVKVTGLVCRYLDFNDLLEHVSASPTCSYKLGPNHQVGGQEANQRVLK